jgi:MFS family permease
MDMRSQIESKRYVLSGISIIALGAWAVLGPFLGTDEAWRWNFNHFMLSVLPAASAVLGGLMMLSRRRLPVSLGGLLALAGGLWFMVGPMTYVLWPSGGLGTGPALGGSVWLAQWIGFFFVTGALITLLSSYALGFVAPLTNEVFEEQAGADVRKPITPEHARRRPSVRQRAARRERPHAQPVRGSARHRS